MNTHDVKSWPEYFRALDDGKNFELRKNDRHYQVGDIVVFHEFDDRSGTYTDRALRRRITYMLDGAGPGAVTPLLGLARGYCILGLAEEECPSNETIATGPGSPSF